MPGYRDSVETMLPYAEPGMSGTIELVDGRWILRDYADAEYLLFFPYGTDLVRLLMPGYRDSAETMLPYAEPGMSGTIELVDGRWILRDYADAEYLLPALYLTDIVRLRYIAAILDARFRESMKMRYPYAKPGAAGTVYLVEENVDAASDISNLIYILTGEPQFVDRPVVNLDAYMPYPGGDTPEFNVVLAGDENSIRNIYNTIVSIESAPNRPPEVVVDLGQIREEQKTNILYLLPESAVDTGSSRTASLLLIKRLASGKYYLQIGLFDRKDVLARELTNLNWAYPYALETSGNPQSPMYKLLVGPVNEGEGNALLLRFKRYGYNDAFIRKEG
jgi:hypothetical protein